MGLDLFVSFDDLIFQTAWKSGLHVGPFKPTCIVQVQEGRWNRGYRNWVGDDVAASIPGESKRKPWQAYWTPSGDWIDVPGVESIRIANGFDQNGLPVADITIANVRTVEKQGTPMTPPNGSPLSGVYYAIERGYLSPLRGYRAPQRPKSTVANEWSRKLKTARRVRTWQGLGSPNGDTIDASTNGGWTFSGLIDDATPRGDTVSITARAGATLSDQRLFGWNKSRQLRDPVIFCDRLVADGTTSVGSAADASSLTQGFAPRQVLSDSRTDGWRSQGHSSADVTEWIEIRLPKGRYTSFVMDPAYDGLEMYVGVYIKGEGTVDGVARSNQWVGDPGDEVPGDNGGWRYIRKAGNVANSRLERSLGAEVVVPDNSILRIGFRKLQKRGQDGYKAGVSYLRALRRRTAKEAKEDDWILIDDVADMVKCVLRWAGFDEWKIEATGVRLSGKLIFNRATFLGDIIQKASEQTGWLFHIGLPSNGESWGVPTWTSNQSLVRQPSMVELRDDQMLTAVEPKLSRETLPYLIRVRGKEAKKGATLGGDTSRRIMAVLETPWGNDDRGDGDLAGVIKHVVLSRPELGTYEECVVAALLVALNAALQQITATAESLANPGIGLNQQVSLIDKAAGVNSRMWAVSTEHEADYQPEGYWRMTIGGSLIDTPDLALVVKMIDGKGLLPRLSPVGRPS